MIGIKIIFVMKGGGVCVKEMDSYQFIEGSRGNLIIIMRILW